MPNTSNQGLLIEIWHSFTALPLWVQIWMSVILVPVNIASLWYINQPLGIWVAVLANMGMIANLPIILHQRGFSKFLAFPHLVFWNLLVGLLLIFRPRGGAGYELYLTILLTVNLISLCFDFTDAVKWWKGNKDIARK